LPPTRFARGAPRLAGVRLPAGPPLALLVRAPVEEARSTRLPSPRLASLAGPLGSPGFDSPRAHHSPCSSARRSTQLGLLRPPPPRLASLAGPLGSPGFDSPRAHHKGQSRRHLMGWYSPFKRDELQVRILPAARLRA